MRQGGVNWLFGAFQLGEVGLVGPGEWHRSCL
jgi:hypothetical protein